MPEKLQDFFDFRSFVNHIRRGQSYVAAAWLSQVLSARRQRVAHSPTTEANLGTPGLADGARVRAPLRQPLLHCFGTHTRDNRSRIVRAMACCSYRVATRIE